MEARMDVLQDREAERAHARRRRNQLARAKGKAYRLAKIRHPDPASLFRDGATWEDVLVARATHVRHHYRHRKVCSCYMCGNFRRNLRGRDRMSLQELRALDSARQTQIMDTPCPPY